MPTAASSFEALVVEYAIAMVAASATFQTLIGATGDAAAKIAAAKALIIKGVGGLPNETGADDETPQKAINCLGDAFVIGPDVSYALVSSQDFTREPIAYREFRHSGKVEIVVRTPLTTDEAPNDAYTRGANLMGAIADEIQAQFGATGKLMGHSVNTAGPSRPDETGAKSKAFDFLITIDWADVI